MACLQAGLHAGCAGGFHADDLHVGVEELCQGGHAAGQAAAADGHQDDVHIREVAENFIGDGALTGGHPQIVEGVDVGQAVLFAPPCRFLCRVVKGRPVQNYVGAVIFCVVHLDKGGGGGHDDGGGDIGVLGGIGHALGMVAGGGSNETGGFLLVGQGADGVVRAANLIGARDLHILRLQVNVIASGLGEKLGVNQTRVVQNAFEDVACCFEIIQSHHWGSSSSII